MDGFFKILDKDFDGKLSFAEFLGEETHMIFKLRDKNNAMMASFQNRQGKKYLVSDTQGTQRSGKGFLISDTPRKWIKDNFGMAH